MISQSDGGDAGLGVAIEKHRRNRRHFQQLVIAKQGVTTTKCHSVENVSRHEPRLHEKDKKQSSGLFLRLCLSFIY